MKTKFYLCCLLFVASALLAFSQEKNDTTLIDTLKVNTDSVQVQKYQIVLQSGRELVGEMLSDDGREVIIKTEKFGKIYIPKYEIKEIVKIDNEQAIIRGEYIAAGPFTTRYAFTTNALPIQKGSNYAAMNLWGPEVHFALSNQFSLGLMTSWLGSPIVLVGKLALPTKNKNVNLSLATMLGSSGYIENFNGYLGLYFANITLGNPKNNLTVSAGYLSLGSFDTKIDDTVIDAPLLSVAGIIKVGPKASFILDTMFGSFQELGGSNSQFFMLMPAMRFQSTDRKAVQISIASIYVKGIYESTSPLPMVTWFYRF